MLEENNIIRSILKIRQGATFALLIFLISGCLQHTDTPFIISGGASYLQKGGSFTKSGQNYSASLTDESAVNVSHGGVLVLSNSLISSTGNSSWQINSNYYGLNAVVLGLTGSKITLSGSTIRSSGRGGIGAYSGDTGTIITLSNDSILTSNYGAIGVDAASGGAMTLTDVIIVTSGAHASAISTDRGRGTVDVLRGIATTYGSNSPGIYSTGTISVTDGFLTANGAEGAIIDGTGKLILINTQLTGNKGLRNCGILLVQSNSGAASGFEGVFTMLGGTLNWSSANGPLFYISNTRGNINLREVSINSSSPILVKTGSDVWGNSGGEVVLTASKQMLSGDILADTSSAIITLLRDTSNYTGAINQENTAKSSAVYFADVYSSWSLTADSYLSVLSDSIGISGNTLLNIAGNGHNVYYDTTYSQNHFWGKNVFSLVNGGMLIPKGSGK